jgi:hypothetical protein
MSWLGKLWALYPALVGLTSAACGVWFCLARNAWALPCALAVLYLVPPLTFRLHQLCWPLDEGTRRLIGGGYEPWWGGHQIQALYIAIPTLEALLRLVPGLYSAWLRLWGSRIGRGVVWTPCVDIVDRSMVEVGDRVVFGHYAAVSGHLINPTRGNMVLYVERVRIGDSAFIGAGSVLGPGVVVANGALVKAGAHVYPGQHVD